MAKRAPSKHVKLTSENIAFIEAAVFSRIEPLLPEPFYLLAVTVEKEAAQWLLQVFIEREPPNADTGISLQDCEQVSRLLDGHWESIDAALQKELPLLTDWSYNLEISSPGLFRPLKTEREFAFYQGRKIRLEKQAGQPAMSVVEDAAKGFAKKTKQKMLPVVLYAGMLQNYDAQTKTVSILDGKTGEPLQIILEDSMQVLLNPPVRLEDEDAVLTTLG